jgi:hypothetical protein
LQIVVALLSPETLLVDGRDKVCAVVVMRTLRVYTVLAHHNIGRRTTTHVELQQVFEELACAEVRAVIIVLEDPLRVDDLLTLVNEGTAHLQQLKPCQVILPMGDATGLVAETSQLEQLDQVRRLASTGQAASVERNRTGLHDLLVVRGICQD